ncbi:MAG: hypothetical protein NXH83_10345 [Rhodobacteraceae bacterium]|nr:hypothetical protein [Paracoccaceae bacterium]
MRRLMPWAAALLVLALAAFVWLDGPRILAAEAAAAQREAQNAMAGALRALKAGEPAALATLIALAFGYGVAHAAGPGHGKLVVGAYGIAGRVRPARLAGVALAASLAQATVAVVLVYAGVLVFDLTRAQLGAMADRWMMQASALAIGAIGLWLALRGMRRLWQARSRAGHDDGHVHGPGCGHAHGPDPAAVARAASPRELAAVIAAVAIRPCTGALFLLVLTWRMGIDAAGIAGAYAMGLGTAVVTVAAALAAATLREGALVALDRGEGALARLLPLAELAAGLAVAALAVAMLGPL